MTTFQVVGVALDAAMKALCWMLFYAAVFYAGVIFWRRTSVGTRSLLFGVHQFLLHPLFVAEAWRRLYGFPWDPRLWVCFVVHDWGYLGKPNMDGPEGERHPEVGAEIVGWLFDGATHVMPLWQRWLLGAPSAKLHRPSGYQFFGLGVDRAVNTWRDFCLRHSRFYAKLEGVAPSRLCAADKIANTLYPAWLYLFLANASGEIREYMDPRFHNRAEFLRGVTSQRQWFEKLRSYLREWLVEYQKNGTTGADA